MKMYGLQFGDDFIFDPEPAKGVASLHIIQGGERMATLKFFAPPWHRTGIQPFFYEIGYFVIRDTLRLSFVITLVLSRKSAIYLDKSSHPGFYIPIHINRVQSNDTIPEPGSQFHLHEIIAPPEPWWAHHPTDGEDNLLWDQWQNRIQNAVPSDRTDLMLDLPLPPWEATVTTTPTGVVFAHDWGKWEVKIEVPEEVEAAFAYEILFPPDKSKESFYLRIACTKNVKLECKMVRDDRGLPPIFVEWNNMLKLDQVPEQGTPLGEGFVWNPITLANVDIVLSDKLQSAVDQLEFFVSLNPITGFIYDAASFAYIHATGRTFFGHKVSREEKFLIGSVALASAAFDFAGPLKKAMGLLAKRSKIIQQVTEKPIIEAIKSRTPGRVMDGIKSASQKEVREITSTIEDIAAGKLRPYKLTAHIDDLLKKYLKPVLADERLIFKILNANGRNFRIPELNAGFTSYFFRKGKQAAKDVLGWALAQRKGSRYFNILQRELGEHWAEIIKEIRKIRDAATVTPRALKIVEEYFMMPHHYRDIKSKTEKMGHLIEVDHITEKRFLSSPRIGGEVDIDDLLAVPVAKNPAIARQLPRNLVQYVHTHKTAMMKDLIPHGYEDLFSIQDWLDATVAVHKSLGMGDDYIKKNIFSEFEFLAKHATPREAIVRRLNPDLTRIRTIGRRIRR